MKNKKTSPVKKQDDFAAFETALVSAVRTALEREGKPGDLTVCDMALPSRTYRGLYVGSAEKTKTVVNLNRLYEEYDGTNLAELAERAVRTMNEQAGFAGELDWLNDYAEVRKCLFIRLVHAESNRKFLETVPHRIIAGLAVIYGAAVYADRESFASVTFRNESIAGYGITEADLYRDALESMRALHDWHVESLREMTGRKTDIDAGTVVTGRTRPNGAANILIPEVQDELIGIYGQKFLILPSSINEVICLPYDEAYAEELSRLVRHVNRILVEPSEILGENTIVFDHGEFKECRL